MHHLSEILCLVLLAGAAIACGGDNTVESSTEPPGPPQPMFQLTSFLTGATANSTLGQPIPGSAPVTNGGPTVQATGNTTVINGGSNQIRLSSNQALSRVIIFVEGAGGYFSIPLRFSSQNVQIVVTIGQNVPRATFTCVYAGVGADGRVGGYVGAPIQVTQVGSGQLQISISWDAPADVDLHVVEPNGEEIYYGDLTSSSGGMLDLDSNANCRIDNVNNENVTWTGVAPRGSFIIRADYWSSCGVSRTNYVVTINDQGRAPRVFQGSFTGNGDRGTRGSGVLVTRYSR